MLAPSHLSNLFSVTSRHVTVFTSPLFPLSSSSPNKPPLLRHQRLHIPDHIRILLNTAIATEKPHPGHTLNTLGHPLLLIFISLIDEVLRLDIAAEIVADEVIIAVIDDAVAERVEARSVAECAGADRVEDFREVWVQGEGGAVGVCVAQVFDVFG